MVLTRARAALELAKRQQDIGIHEQVEHEDREGAVKEEGGLEPPYASWLDIFKQENVLQETQEKLGTLVKKARANHLIRKVRKKVSRAAAKDAKGAAKEAAEQTKTSPQSQSEDNSFTAPITAPTKRLDCSDSHSHINRSITTHQNTLATWRALPVNATTSPAVVATIERILGHTFRDKKALLHAAPGLSGSRIETLRLALVGDRVLGLLLRQKHFLTIPALTNGQIAKLCGDVESNHNLAKVGRRVGLACFARGEPNMPPSEKSIADTVEALIGAAYLDGGIDAAAQVMSNLNLT